MKKGQKSQTRTPKLNFDKYKLYEASVQAVDGDIEFITDTFKELRGQKPLVLREDFCGTGKLCNEWVKQGPQHKAFGLDLDLEPLEYGKTHHWAKLKKSEQDRVTYLRRNVLDAQDVKADAIVAFNFSYFVFKKRREMLHYFQEVRKALLPGGVFFIDLFGGPDSQTVMEEKSQFRTHTYYWDCQKFNPISNECFFAIHFKPKNGKKVENVFTYDWRLWTLPELREILKEAGFPKTYAYWEEDDDKGGGNGVYYQTEEAENCLSWVAYIAALA